MLQDPTASSTASNLIEHHFDVKGDWAHEFTGVLRADEDKSLVELVLSKWRVAKFLALSKARMAKFLAQYWPWVLRKLVEFDQVKTNSIEDIWTTRRSCATTSLSRGVARSRLAQGHQRAPQRQARARHVAQHHGGVHYPVHAPVQLRAAAHGRAGLGDRGRVLEAHRGGQPQPVLLVRHVLRRRRDGHHGARARRQPQVHQGGDSHDGRAARRLAGRRRAHDRAPRQLGQAASHAAGRQLADARLDDTALHGIYGIRNGGPVVPIAASTAYRPQSDTLWPRVAPPARQAAQLEWEVSPELQEGIKFAVAKLMDLILQNEVEVLEPAAFGKLFIKQHTMSPDAFVQMAFIAANNFQYGYGTKVYESALTKRFLHGRTEAAITMTTEMLAFCETFSSQKSPLDKIESLRAAVVSQVEIDRNCASGEGVERHLDVSNRPVSVHHPLMRHLTGELSL
ncbi:Choline carnitine o, partial [Globisporangium splendens]